MAQTQPTMPFAVPKQEFPRTSPMPTNAAAGAKRKRGPTEQKFYGVAKGKRPGVYYTWEECLDQVRGQKGALFKAFPSLPEAQSFVDGKPVEPSARSRAMGEQKYYAVQNGRVPGVYTDWPSAQKQIIGVRNPKHKKFNSRQEAEAFVKAGQKNTKATGLGDPSRQLTVQEQLEKAMYERDAPGMVLDPMYAPKDKEGNTYIAGKGPVPPGAEDNYDPNLKFEPDGSIRYKTTDEKRKTKTITVSKEGAGTMLKIYTDGSSLSNGQAGARAGVGVFFGPGDAKYATPLSPSPSPHSREPRTQIVYTIDWEERFRDRDSCSPPPRKRPWLTTRHPRNVSEALKGSRQTNQRAELTAISRALDIAPRHRPVTIYTDSRYAIDCVTNWYVKWKTNGWVNAKGKPVENQDLIKGIREHMEERETLGVGTWYVWVKGHATDEGNIAADRLAVAGARLGTDLDSDAEGEENESADDEMRRRSVTTPDGDYDAEGDLEDREAVEAFKAMKHIMSEDYDDADDEEKSKYW